jgi:L-lactate permease
MHAAIALPKSTTSAASTVAGSASNPIATNKLLVVCAEDQAEEHGRKEMEHRRLLPAASWAAAFLLCEMND